MLAPGDEVTVGHHAGCVLRIRVESVVHATTAPAMFVWRIRSDDGFVIGEGHTSLESEGRAWVRGWTGDVVEAFCAAWALGSR